VPVLFIDDLGNAGHGTEKEDRSRIAFAIINHRYNYKLPTLITTNLTFDALSEQFDYKTARRLKSEAVWITMSGEALGLRGGQHE